MIYKYISIYLILLCLESLILKHLGLPYPCRFIWQEKFWRHLLPYIGTNQVSRLFRLFSYKVLVEFNKFGKEKKDGKTKQSSKRKEYAMQSWKILIFCFVSTKLCSSPSVSKTQIHRTALCNGVQIRLLSSAGDIS